MKNPLRQTRYLMSETSHTRLPAVTAEVAFFGRSNAGKSSTLCALCDNNKLARVSKTPGRTREINVFEVTRSQWLVDLPGLGFARAEAKLKNYWPEMISEYLVNRPSLRRIFYLADAKIGLQENDMVVLDWIRQENLPLTLVGVKIDKVSRSHHKALREKMAQQAGLDPAELHWISPKKKYGIDQLNAAVMEALR